MNRIAHHSLGILQRTIHDLTRPDFLKQSLWVLLFGAFTVSVILFNINLLKTRYPDPVRPDDLILDLVPQMPVFVEIAETISLMQAVVVFLLLWQGRFKGAPRLMFLLRSFTIVLTPLEDTITAEAAYAEDNWIAQTFYHGMYFSGHTASAFIQAFFFKGSRWRPVLFVLAMGQVVSLILSHGHYSIDIVGGFFVAYTLTHFDFMRLVPHPLLGVRWLPWSQTTPVPVAL